MIGFRVDANEIIATGHLMRCMAIADRCRSRGEKCLFLLAENQETARLEAAGFSYQVLQSQWDDLDSELSVMESMIRKYHINRLVVDSYQVTAHYLSELNQCVPVLYIDDMLKEPYEISALVHYIQWEDENTCEALYQNTDVKLLSGIKYIPLRTEFTELNFMSRTACAAARSGSKEVLVTTGGTDTYNIAGRLMCHCLPQKEWENYIFHVIVGNMNRNEAMLQELADRYPALKLHKNISNMSDYMKKCMLAVSAGGTTLYELCACQLPTVCFSFADNQMELTRQMQQRQIMFYAGDVRENDQIEEKIADYLLLLRQNPEIYAKYQKHMGQLVDGQGSSRIAEFLCT